MARIVRSQSHSTLPPEHAFASAVAVPLADWHAKGDTRLPLLLTVSDSAEALPTDLSRIPLIVFESADFNDGRLFSIGRALRQAGFSGELRVSGDFLPDQLQYLSRCGFDSFEVPDTWAESDIEQQLNWFSVTYQSTPAALEGARVE